MSLSQKHSGKILVPWYNLAEWKAVYHLIYGEINWTKALEILKVWKIRTPLLSAGVEGTLIILEALLFDARNRSLFEVTHIYSTSLVRFLNLSAANSDKQGMFYKTATKNGLPKWLISIRHDIAHSHQVPSLSMLDLSLKFCLDWLKEKYWDVQHEYMTDFVINVLNYETLEYALEIYLYILNSEEILNEDITVGIQNLIKNYDITFSKQETLEALVDFLTNLMQSNKPKSAEIISGFLINTNTFLCVEIKTELGIKNIPVVHLQKWEHLLNLLHKVEILYYVVFNIFHFICDFGHSKLCREVASLWIRDIFQALINKERNNEDNGNLCFMSINNSLKNMNFVTEIIENSTPYTLNFVKEVLEYNNVPLSFIGDCMLLVSAISNCNISENNNIFTVKNLITITETDTSEKLTNKLMQSKSRWILIEDVSAYENLPLGILPHQDINCNPLLNL